MFRKSKINDHLIYCSECDEWYDPLIPSDWSTAHHCPSEKIDEILRKLERIEQKLNAITI